MSASTESRYASATSPEVSFSSAWAMSDSTFDRSASGARVFSSASCFLSCAMRPLAFSFISSCEGLWAVEAPLSGMQ